MLCGESTYGNNGSSDYANEGICPSVVLRNHEQARRTAVHRVKLGYVGNMYGSFNNYSIVKYPSP